MPDRYEPLCAECIWAVRFASYSRFRQDEVNRSDRGRARAPILGGDVRSDRSQRDRAIRGIARRTSGVLDWRVAARQAAFPRSKFAAMHPAIAVISRPRDPAPMIGDDECQARTPAGAAARKVSSERRATTAMDRTHRPGTAESPMTYGTATSRGSSWRTKLGLRICGAAYAEFAPAAARVRPR